MGSFLDSGGLDLVGGLVDSGLSLVSSALNAKHQSKEAAKQRAWQEQMWHAQNNYNHPANVAARMKAAGLSTQGLGQNPVSAGSVGSGAAAAGAPWQLISPLEGLKSVAEYEAIKAGTDKTETQTEKIIKEMQLLEIAAETGLIDKETKELQKKKLQEEYRRYMEAGDAGVNEFMDEHNVKVANYNQAMEYINNLQADQAYKSALTSLVDHQKNLTDAQAEQARSMAEQISQKTKIDGAKFPAELRSEYLKSEILDAEAYIKQSVERQREYDSKISELLDIPIFDLPEVIRGNIHAAITKAVKGEVTFDAARNAIIDMLNRYAKKEYSIILPYSWSGSGSIFGFGGSGSVSGATIE